MNRLVLARRLLAGAVLLGCASAAQAGTVRCESKNNAYASCYADTSGGVRLTHQLSSQGCWQNDTWGYDRNRIWVTRGCRAEFTTGRQGSSGNGDKAAAAIAIALVGAAVIASQRDKDRDHDREDWGDDSYGGEPRSVFRCESRDNRYSYCRVPVRGHVEIYRQQSSSPCQYGRSWGQERDRVWVSEGCRADFAVY